MSSIEAAVLGAQLADDYGVWNNYGLQQSTFVWTYEKGIIKEKLGKKEYDSIPWAKLEAGDPSFLQDIYRRIAYKEGELGTMLGARRGLLGRGVGPGPASTTTTTTSSGGSWDIPSTTPARMRTRLAS